MLTLEVLWLICPTIVCGVLFYVAVKNSKRHIDDNMRIRQDKIANGKPPRIERGQVDSECGICFGHIGNEVIMACGCGRVFHVDCVDAIDECPYCKRKKDAMTERNAVKTACPNCGKPIDGNICVCGAVVPNPDDTYVCRCGSTASIDSGCSECGSTIVKTQR